MKEPQEAFEDDALEKDDAQERAEPIEHDNTGKDAALEEDDARAGAIVGDRKDGSIRDRKAQG
jgi:hypothetical protein